MYCLSEWGLSIVTPVLEAFKNCGMQRMRSGQVRPTGIKHLSVFILTISNEKQNHQLMLNLKGLSI